jgi:hypothetical protein
VSVPVPELLAPAGTRTGRGDPHVCWRGRLPTPSIALAPPLARVHRQRCRSSPPDRAWLARWVAAKARVVPPFSTPDSLTKHDAGADGRGDAATPWRERGWVGEAISGGPGPGSGGHGGRDGSTAGQRNVGSRRAWWAVKIVVGGSCVDKVGIGKYGREGSAVVGGSHVEKIRSNAVAVDFSSVKYTCGADCPKG